MDTKNNVSKCGYVLGPRYTLVVSILFVWTKKQFNYIFTIADEYTVMQNAHTNTLYLHKKKSLISNRIYAQKAVNHCHFMFHARFI